MTFYRDVVPVLQNRCQTCHRPGEVGQFSLMTYRQAVNWADDIKEYTRSRQMPPWKPVEGPAFHNDRRLSEREIATLAAWVDGGTPKGDPAEAPAPRRFVPGWQFGKPDLVLTVDQDFQIGASGRDLFRCFVLPTNLPEDKHVTAVEVRPGNPRVVHHALLFLDTSGQGRQLEQAEQQRKKDPAAMDIGPGDACLREIVAREGLGAIAAGEDGLAEIVDRAIAADPDAAEKVRGGNMKAIGPLVGRVMRETKGRADGGEITRLIRERLQG